jgi:hypothetical protein
LEADAKKGSNGREALREVVFGSRKKGSREKIKYFDRSIEGKN